MLLDVFLPFKLSGLSSITQSLVSQRQCVYLAFLVFGFSRLDVCSSLCGGRITVSSGVIKSPVYSITSSFSCKWVITAKSYQKISLTFTSFSVTMGFTDSSCDVDYVEIIDGNDSLGKYCNSWNQYPKSAITSKTNSITLVFKTNDSLDKKQSTFEATFKTFCGGWLTGSKGEIISPNYPGPYPVPQYCSWKIQVPKDSVIRFFFLEFNLARTSKCNMDYVRAIDGLNSTSRLIGHFCADRTPPKTLRSTSNSLMLEFKSFKPTSVGGFHFYYEAEPHCGGVLRGNTGSFTSPGYGTQIHITSIHECVWTIEVPDKMLISVVFASFDVKDMKSSPTTCADDYVEILDGSGSTATSMGRYCGRHVTNPPTVRSTKNTMMIRLHLSTDSGKGFFATYTAVDPKNPYDKCAEASDELLYKCTNGNYIQCQWKCDGTDDCGDNSDEQNCATSKTKKKKSNKITSYLVILVSITGTAVLIALVIFIIDRLRKKRRSQATNRRRRRRRARLRALDGDLRDATSPPPTYDFAVSISSCCDTTSNPPTYDESMTPQSTSDSTEITGVSSQTENTEVELSGDNQEETSACQTNDNQQVLETHDQEIEVECISLGESPPSSDTSPLIV